MSFQPSESLAEQIAQHLAEQIIMGDLVEGERIQELRIASELNVSRGSVREALLLLARRQLIQIYPRRGAVVAELSAVQVKGLYEFLSMMLQVVFRKTALNWRQLEMEPFAEGLTQLQEYVDELEVEAFYEGVLELFRHYFRFTHNTYIEEVLDDLLPSVRRCYFLALHANRREVAEAYAFLKGLHEALLQRKSDDAASWAEAFCQHQCQMVLDSLVRVKQIELAWAQRSRR